MVSRVSELELSPLRTSFASCLKLKMSPVCVAGKGTRGKGGRARVHADKTQQHPERVVNQYMVLQTVCSRGARGSGVRVMRCVAGLKRCGFNGKAAGFVHTWFPMPPAILVF